MPAFRWPPALRIDPFIHCILTLQVSPSKQKILGLKAMGSNGGGKVNDATLIVDLDLSNNSAKKPAMLLGTPDAAHDRLKAEIEAQPQNQDPEDEDEGGDEESTIDLAQRPDIVAKLEARFQRANIVQLNEPRKTKTAVFDIDYTFFDLSGTSERPEVRGSGSSGPDPNSALPPVQATFYGTVTYRSIELTPLAGAAPAVYQGVHDVSERRAWV